MNRDFDGRPCEQVDDGFERLHIPGTGGRARFAAFCLRLGGWTIGGPPPKADKYVIIAAPHTTWWDGFWMLAFAWWWGIHLNWMGKKSITRGALGPLAKRAGLVPVDRSAPQGLVAQMVEQFESHERIFLAIPPEGTRAKRDYWKSGFIKIARGAEVPVCMSYLDYEKREAGFGPLFIPSEEVSTDMDRVRRFYKRSWGRHPELFTHPRLREEDVVVKLDSRKPKEEQPLAAASNQ